MADTGLKYHIALDRDAKDGTLCTLALPEHELLLKYEIRERETSEMPSGTEGVGSSSVELEKAEVENVLKEPEELPKKAIELEIHSNTVESPPPELQQTETIVGPPFPKENLLYKSLIEIILRIPGMREKPSLRYRLLPSNLRVRHIRSELNAQKDLEYILDVAESNQALSKIFTNIKSEILKVTDYDLAVELRSKLNAVVSQFKQPNRQIVPDFGKLSCECRETLRNKLATHFNLSELYIMCFDMRIPFDDLAGNERMVKAVSLIEYLERHDRILEFLDRCKRARENVDWSC